MLSKLMALFATAAAAPPLPAPATFYERPSFTAPLLSPDGRFLAARVRADQKEELCIIAVAALEAACKHRLSLGPFKSATVMWAGDATLLIGTARDLFGVLFGYRTYVQVDPSTGLGKPLDATPAKGTLSQTIIWADPAGRSVLVSSLSAASRLPSVERIDLSTGAKTLIEKPRPPILRWFADADGNVRAGLGYRGTEFAAWYRDAPGDELRKISMALASGRKDGEDMIETFRFDGPGGRKLVVTNGPTGRFAAYGYDDKFDRIGEAVFEHPEVDVTGVKSDPRGRGVAGISYEDDRRRVHWLTPEMRTLQARIDKVFPTTVNDILGQSRDGNLVLVGTSGPAAPGSFFLFDQKAKRMEGLTSAYDALASVRLGTMEPIRYAARDGLTIRGYVTLPPGREPRNLPLIVMPHGGPYARDSWAYDPIAQFVATRGYAVLQPNFRGSTGYGRQFVERGYGAWGGAMQDDLLDGIAALAAEGRIDPKRVCIVGISYGGYAALWGAIRDGAHYRCAASYAGISDLRAMLRHDRRQFAAPRYARTWEARVAGEEKLDLALTSPLSHAGRATVPLFIGHGEKDTNVLPSQSKAMVTALGKTGIRAETVFYKDSGHGFDQEADFVDYLTRLEAFLKKYNPAD